MAHRVLSWKTDLAQWLALFTLNMSSAIGRFVVANEIYKEHTRSFVVVPYIVALVFAVAWARALPAIGTILDIRSTIKILVLISNFLGLALLIVSPDDSDDFIIIFLRISLASGHLATGFGVNIPIQTELISKLHPQAQAIWTP